MTLGDWIGSVGLLLSILGAAWTLFLETRSPEKRHTTSAALTLLSIIVGGSVFGYERWTNIDLRTDVKHDVSQTLDQDPGRFWTFNDLMAVIRPRHPRPLIPLEPVLQEALFDLIEDLAVQGPERIWVTGAPPTQHRVTVYCRACNRQ